MDGGVTALGSNIFNMAVVGAILPYFVFLMLKRVLPQTRGGFLAAAGLASWLSIVAASAACALELAISGTLPLGPALAAMTGIHSIIGVGEALVSVGVLSVVLSVRPDLVRAWNPNHIEAVCQSA
jgi:cobalt/nickel transport system permease protein